VERSPKSQAALKRILYGSRKQEIYLKVIIINDGLNDVFFTLHSFHFDFAFTF